MELLSSLLWWDSVLENVESIEYLWVAITNAFRWNTHFGNICTKANRSIPQDQTQKSIVCHSLTILVVPAFIWASPFWRFIYYIISKLKINDRNKYGYLQPNMNMSCSFFKLVLYLSVLLYGLEVIVPTGKTLTVLETQYKRFIKQVLSIPTTIADSAVYLLNGALLVEAVIHKRILSLFGNIMRLPNESIELQLIKRQLETKTYKSHSWFIVVKKVLLEYELPSLRHW